MDKVIKPTNPPECPEEEKESTHKYRPVSSLEARLHTSSQTVIVKFKDDNNEKSFTFVLSPPAAKQLSDQLAKATEKYLQLIPERKHTASEFVPPVMAGQLYRDDD